MDKIIELCKEVAPLILGSVVIAELIKIVADRSKNRLNKKIDYESEVARETNKKINEIMIGIRSCDYSSLHDDELESHLYELQSYLNVSGYTRKYDYNSDGHAWKDIERLRNSKNEKEFNSNKELLIMDLVLILQFHKNNIKKDIQGRKINGSGIVISLIIIALHTISYFLAFGLSDVFVYLYELFWILSTIVFLPGFLFDSTFEMKYFDKHARKRETFSKMLKQKKKRYWVEIAVSILLAIVGISLVFLLRLGSLPQVEGASNAQEKYFESEEEARNEETAYEDLINVEAVNQESKDEKTENIESISAETVSEKTDISVEEKSDGKNTVTELQENKFLIFRIFSVIYCILGFFHILIIWVQKADKFSYEETVRKLRIEKNKLYVREIKELVCNAKKQMSQKDGGGYTLECDKMLVLAYAKLSDLKDYYITEKNKRMSAMESYKDVKREMGFFENEDKVKQALNLFKKIGKNKIVKKKKWKEDSKKRSKFLVLNRKEKNIEEITKTLKAIEESLDKICLG